MPNTYIHLTRDSKAAFCYVKYSDNEKQRLFKLTSILSIYLEGAT